MDAPFAVSTSFLPILNCTLPEGFDERLCPAECGGRGCARVNRLTLHMELYKREAVFGVLENKLLNKLVLRSLRVPHAAWRYAALVPPRDGDVSVAAAVHRDAPWYARERLLAAISAATDRRFVLKPLTEGGAASVVVMDAERWGRMLTRRNATSVEERLVDQLERKALLRERSSWNQEFEHRGVLLEERYDAEAEGSTYELKLFVVFGQALGVRLYPRRRAVDGARDDGQQSYVELVREPLAAGRPLSGRFRCLPTAVESQASVCAAAIVWINAQSTVARLDEWAMSIARMYSADWFRLDVFAGDARRGLLVNEVTYPSHVPPPAGVWQQYLARYADRASWTTEAAHAVLDRVSAASGIPVSFMRTRSTIRRHAERSER